jgi:hypothetical protein
MVLQAVARCQSRFLAPKFFPMPSVTGEVDFVERHFEGRRKYEDRNQLALSLVKPDRLFITCSCSGFMSLEEFKARVIKAAHRLNRRRQFSTAPAPARVIPFFQLPRKPRPQGAVGAGGVMADFKT